MTVRDLIQKLLSEADLNDVIIENDPRDDWYIHAEFEVVKVKSEPGVVQLKEVK